MLLGEWAFVAGFYAMQRNIGSVLRFAGNRFSETPLVPFLFFFLSFGQLCHAGRQACGRLCCESMMQL